jgi:hypothetical protein
MSVADTLNDVLELISGDVALLKETVAANRRALGIDEQRGLTAYARALSEIADIEARRKAPPGDMAALLERASKIPELRDLIMRGQQQAKPAGRGGSEEE